MSAAAGGPGRAAAGWPGSCWRVRCGWQASCCRSRAGQRVGGWAGGHGPGQKGPLVTDAQRKFSHTHDMMTCPASLHVTPAHEQWCTSRPGRHASLWSPNTSPLGITSRNRCMIAASSAAGGRCGGTVECAKAAVVAVRGAACRTPRHAHLPAQQLCRRMPPAPPPAAAAGLQPAGSGTTASAPVAQAAPAGQSVAARR